MISVGCLSHGFDIKSYIRAYFPLFLSILEIETATSLILNRALVWDFR